MRVIRAMLRILMNVSVVLVMSVARRQCVIRGEVREHDA